MNAATPDRLADAVRRLEAVRNFDGAPEKFWPDFLAALTDLSAAQAGLVLVRPAAGAEWKSVVSHGGLAGLASAAPAMADTALRDGAVALLPFAAQEGVAAAGWAAAVPLALGAPDQQAAVVLASAGPGGARQDLRSLLALAADIPSVYQLRRLYAQARADIERFAGALDLMVLLNGETKFLAAAMTFCNELASRFRCDRVSLGWLEDRYVRVKAISHMEKFEKKMAAVQGLESAMEEALDQGEELVWPAPKDARWVLREHEAYTAAQAVRHLVSVPLHLDGKVAAMLVCERNSAPFAEGEVRQLRLLCDQAARRLGDLQRASRWFGARLKLTLQERLAAWSGAEHTLGKTVAAALTAAFLFVALVPLPYRVEAPFTLRGEDVRFLPAPYDAYIDTVSAEKGQAVKAGETLLTLDTRDLILEEASAAADLSRYTAEAEKARAENRLAEMRIAQAQADQAHARLKMVRHRLAQAQVRSPFGGVVVDGDLKDRVGAPVKQGDLLLKVAQLDRMHAQLAVAERDIHLIRDGAAGHVAFASQPRLKFPIRVEHVEPAAVTRDEGNVFLVHGVFAGGLQPWWRPGMTGIAKVRAGWRTTLWMMTHRTADYLRLRFW